LQKSVNTSCYIKDHLYDIVKKVPQICKIWIGASLLCDEYSQNLRKPTKSEDSFNISEHVETLIKIQQRNKNERTINWKKKRISRAKWTLRQNWKC
jgi:hypothetical protein